MHEIRYPPALSSVQEAGPSAASLLGVVLVNYISTAGRSRGKGQQQLGGRHKTAPTSIEI